MQTLGFVNAVQQADGPQAGPRRRLGEFLVEAGAIDKKALAKALEIHSSYPGRGPIGAHITAILRRGKGIRETALP